MRWRSNSLTRLVFKLYSTYRKQFFRSFDALTFSAIGVGVLSYTVSLFNEAIAACLVLLALILIYLAWMAFLDRNVDRE